jgi:hypothetical protein
MAIKPLETRLDDLSQAQAGINELQAEQESDVLAAEPIEFQESVPLEGGEQVAGLGLGGIKGLLKSAPRRTEAPVVQPGKAVETIGPYQVIPDAEPAVAEKVLQTAPTMPTTGKPSPSLAEIQAGVPETAFNLDQITDSDGLKQFIEATGRAYGADKLVKVSYKDIATKAANEGYDEAFLARVINPMEKTQANPADAYKMMLAIVDAGKRAFDLGEKVKSAKQAGNLSPELASEFQQAVALEGVLLKAARGRQADIARTLGIFSQARQSTAQRGAMLEAVVNESGGMTNAFKLAERYTALDSKGARSAVSEKAISGQLLDVWMTTWINGLLSSPVTHAKNIAGNALFTGLQIPERALASVIGKARVAIAGGEDAITGDEVYAQAMGMLHGLREGFDFGKTAFVKNEATDPFTKIEASRAGRDPFDVSFGDSELGKALTGAMRYYGKFATLPGRALMAEDEFFKGVAYRMELNALAVREGHKEYKKLVAAGLDDATATKQAQDTITRILTDTPDDIDEAAKGFSRTTTFTRQLETELQGAQRILATPLMKMFVPFVKTPTNIMLEAMARTPGLNFASPRFWADYNAGGVRRDMAVSRVTLGSGMIFATGTLALEGKMTGYGPFRTEDRKALEGTGWQPFSFVFNKEDVSDEDIARFSEITKINVGPEKVYISYAGLEPMSALLAIAGTAGEYSMMEAGGADMERLMLGGALATYTYLGDQPMLSGVGDIVKIVSSGAKDAPGFLYNLFAQVSKQGTEFLIGGSPLGAYSSLVAATERYINPERSQVLAAVSDAEVNPLDGATKGFFEAVGYYKSRNPLTSDSLPPMLDTITGDTKKAGKGNLYEMFSPIRRSDGTTSMAHAVLVDYGIPQFSPPKKIDGVELSAEQYTRWIELATRDGELARNIETLGENPRVRQMAAVNLGMAQDLIRKEISDAYSIAKDQLLAEDPDLADMVREMKDEIQAERGLYKR